MMCKNLTSKYQLIPPYLDMNYVVDCWGTWINEWYDVSHFHIVQSGCLF